MDVRSHQGPPLRAVRPVAAVGNRHASIGNHPACEGMYGGEHDPRATVARASCPEPSTGKRKTEPRMDADER
jgi:hypothetical protein